MQLVDEAKNWWKMYSVWLFALIGLATYVQAQWGTFSQVIPQSWQPYVVTVLSVIGIVGRLVKQGSVTPADPEASTEQAKA